MFLLSWASHALATEHTAGLAELGITPRVHCVLHKATGASLTQTQLADACGLEKTTMVVIMDKLEKEGLAERRSSPRDRRSYIIFVTGKGRRLLDRADKIVSQIERDVLSTLPDGLRDALLEGLTRLINGRLATFAVCEQPPRREAEWSP